MGNPRDILTPDWYPAYPDIAAYVLKPDTYVAGNLASFTSEGNVQDSGVPGDQVPRKDQINIFTEPNTFSDHIKTPYITDISGDNTAIVYGISVVNGKIATHNSIADFDDGVRTNRLDQMAAPTTDLSMNGQKIVTLADPTQPQDAATAAYTDALLDRKISGSAGDVLVVPAGGVGAETELGANFVKTTGVQDIFGGKRFHSAVTLDEGITIPDKSVAAILSQARVSGVGSQVQLGKNYYTSGFTANTINEWQFDPSIDGNGQFASLPATLGYSPTQHGTIGTTGIDALYTSWTNAPVGALFLIIAGGSSLWLSNDVTGSASFASLVAEAELNRLEDAAKSGIEGGAYVAIVMKGSDQGAAEWFNQDYTAVINESFFVCNNSLICMSKTAFHLSDVELNDSRTILAAKWAFDHLAATNPHSLTKSTFGLENVTNVEQLPLSYLEQTVTPSASKVPSSQGLINYVSGLGLDFNSFVWDENYNHVLDENLNPVLS